MKSVIKQSIKKSIAILISTIIISQFFLISSFADNGSEDDIKTDNGLISSKIDTVPNIVCEIVNERAEYTKVYLLEDGSFYSITTMYPIHKKLNGKWVDINQEGAVSVPKKVKDAESMLQLTMKTSIPSRGVNNQLFQPSLLINTLGTTVTNAGIIFEEYTTILIKPLNVGSYLSKNKAITTVEVSFDCTVESGHDTAGKIIVGEENTEWDAQTTENDYDYEYDQKQTLDYICIDEDGTYSWNITNLYNRWDTEITENNGIVLYTESACNLIIDTPYISIRYTEIDDLDANFTYHTIDMGRAGTVFINDYTHTIRVEENLLGICYI